MFPQREGSYSVLQVDDDPQFLEFAATALEREDGRLHVRTAPDAERALEMVELGPPDCVVSDYRMPGTDGLAFLATLRENYPDLPFVLFTGEGSEEVAAELVGDGAADYIQKTAGAEQYAVLANRVVNLAERYRTERRAARTRRRVEKLVTASTDVIMLLDGNGRFRYLSPAIERLLGYRPEELLGESPFDYVHPDDLDAAREEYGRLVADPSFTARVDTRLRHRDGSWVFVENRGRNLLADPDVEGVVVYTRDVSERRRRERDLERYEAIVRDMQDGAWITDPEGRITYVSERAASALGYRVEDLVGRETTEVVREEGLTTASAAETLDDRVRAVLRGEREAARCRLPIDSPAGEMVLECRIAPMYREGEMTGVVGVARDVSELAERETELAAQRDRLAEFAGAVSHDLQTPLGVARGHLALAAEVCDSPHLDSVDTAHGRMHDVIHDLLSLARVGRVIDDPERVDLATVARESWDTVDTPGGRLVVDGTRPLLADEGRLRNVFENLFRNSVEHSSTSSRPPADDSAEHSSTGNRPGAGDADEGRARRSADRPDPEMSGDGGDDAGGSRGFTVRVGPLDDGFYVEDDGPGVPATDRDRVFELGYSTREGGTGYGLAVVRQIVEVHGWGIRVDSGRDGGARFVVSGVEAPQPARGRDRADD